MVCAAINVLSREKNECLTEDFGGHLSSGRGLEGEGDVRHGSAFLCQLAGAEQKRPVGILTNLLQVQSKFFLHWPCLITCGDELHYNGALPISFSCPYVPQHDPFRETGELANFVSLSSQSGSSVWLELLTVRSAPLGIAIFLLGAAQALPSPGFLFSFSSGAHSRSSSYSHWRSLTRSLLADVASSGQVSAFLWTPVPPDTQSTRRSAFGSASIVTAVGLALGTTSSLQSSSSLGPREAISSSTSSSHRGRDHRSTSPFLSRRSIAPQGYSVVDGGPSWVLGASACVVRTWTVHGRVTLCFPFV